MFMLTKTTLTAYGVALALTSGLGSAVMAQPADGPGGQPPSGPPPEAIAACAGKTEGSTVSFTGRNGETFTGTCQKDGTQLAARPSAPSK
jgi:hypothetical protein